MKQPKSRNRSAKPKITQVSIARLYSLGNYEHVRFELTANVPEGCSAKDTFLGLAAVCGRLRPVKKPYQYEHAMAVLNKLPEQQSESEKASLEEYAKIVGEYEGAKALQRGAFEALDDLGGTSKRGGRSKDEDDVPW